MKASAFAVLFVALCVVIRFEYTLCARKLIVVLIDGVRWDYLEDSKLKGFRQLMSHGVKAQYVVPIYPSLSYPNWYSIATGLYGENHGFINNFMYDDTSKLFYLMNPHPDATNPIWWNEAEPIWITAEKNNMSTAMYWWGGCEVRIKDHHPMICERERFGPPTPEEREDFIERIEDMIELFKPSKRFDNDRLSLAMMYYGPTDYAGHKFGPKSREVTEALLDIDGILEKMQSKLAKSGLKDEVNIIVVSDHGMTNVENAKTVDLEKFSGDIKYQVSMGTDAQLIPKDGALDKLYSDLKASHLKGVDVYKKDEIPVRYHIKESKRMTPIYLVAQKGYLIKALNDPSKYVAGAPHKIVGHHGYDPTINEDMRTIFIASGPDFKSGYKNAAINITDIYNVMCKVLNLKPLPNNGSWDKVSSMLMNSITPHSDLHTHSKSSGSSGLNRDNGIYFTFVSLFSIVSVMVYFKSMHV